MDSLVCKIHSKLGNFPGVKQEWAKQGPRRGIATVALLLGLVAATVVFAAPVSIDSFDDGTLSLQADNYTKVVSGTIEASGIFGDERDAVLEFVSGTGARVNLDIDYDGASNRLALSTADDTYVRTIITWDGTDNDPTILDTGGLSLNLANEGVDGFLIQILSADHKSKIGLQAYTDSNWSEAVADIPVLSPGIRMDLFLPFDSFVTRGGTGVSWSNVGALSMVVDGTVELSLDMSIDLVAATSAREYGDLPIQYEKETSKILSANHIPQGMRLGNNCDAESAYQASDTATGDDASQADDEDGVTPIYLPWLPGIRGGGVELQMKGCSSSANCYVNGWIDWNNDGDFSDTIDGASERIVSNGTLSSDGTLSVLLNTPTSFSHNYYFARFRICTSAAACDSPDDTDTNVINGEIEDYVWWLGPTGVDLASFTATGRDRAVSLDWATANENDLLGFNLWRNTDAGDPGDQLNAVLIEANNAGSPFGSSYSYLDDGLANGTTYYYWLESVEVGDVRTWHGPASAMAMFRSYLPLVLRR